MMLRKMVKDLAYKQPKNSYSRLTLHLRLNHRNRKNISQKGKNICWWRPEQVWKVAIKTETALPYARLKESDVRSLESSKHFFIELVPSHASTCERAIQLLGVPIVPWDPLA